MVSPSSPLPRRPATTQARSLYAQSLDPSLTPDAVESKVRAWEGLTKPQLETVAKDIVQIIFQTIASSALVFALL